ncbi:MAG: hypothetical protein KJ814_11205 [Proteobacteria bacterium]|nr:hypothetical protein [Pseudomonadota bacterium]
MISGAYIKEWRQKVPWSKNDQVEQDLIICRALVEINSREHFTVLGRRMNLFPING